MRLTRYPRTLATLAVIAALTVAIAAAFDWNWLKGPLQSYLSDKLGRAFVINGDLKGEFSLSPMLTGSDVTLANAPWGSEPHLGRAKEVAVRVDLRSLFSGSVSLPELALADATFLLERDAEGRENWDFGERSSTIDVGRLSVGAGSIRFFDRERGIDIRTRVESAKAGDDGQLTIRFDGDGTWEDGGMKLKGTATTPFAAKVTDRPYQVDVQAQTGATSGAFAGTIVPSRGGELAGRLSVKGPDLSQLGAFVPIEFSRTPPYRITGQLTHARGLWTLRELDAKVGETDLSGRLDFDRSGKRTQVTADLASQSANYRDMRALIGMSADDLRHARADSQSGSNKSGEELPARRDRAKGSADLSRLQLVDAKIKLKARRFTVPELRLDNLSTTIDLKDGVMKMQPLDFGLAGGKVASTVSVNARDRVAKATADVTVRDVNLNELVPKLKPPSGSAGKASGRGHFTATGNSIAEMLSTTDGELALMSAGGNAGTLSTGLGRIDLARAGKWLVRGDANAPIQCAVGDLVVHDGVMTLRRLVINTDTDTIVGHGTINLAKKRYDLELDLQTKHPTLFGFGGPVLIDGTFDNPNVHRKGGPMLARVGAALGLSAVNPVAALLPLVDLGDETGANCKGLVQKTRGKINELEASDPAANGSATGPASGSTNGSVNASTNDKAGAPKRR